ncbi:citrate synthase [uncultured Paludibaculum sp.]|uniref:citrate synthase n=1 Tax=uncultured Paludibaculum sp. TaxID=1765020 RepID=UPI002AAC2977|nr:citrate synthase [uncultured Paludibaculum sp.]
MDQNRLSITDQRTGTQYEVPIVDGTIRATDLRKIKATPDDFGLMTYDPAFLNTSSCRSAITYIDGDRGILRYRGYPIEELAESCSFLEVAWLLLNGELPNTEELADWTALIKRHTMLHETTKKFLEGYRYDAHPMGMLISTLAALSTVYPEAKNVFDADNRKLQIARLIAKMPTICAYCYRHHFGLPYVYPDNDLNFTENFMNMMWKMFEPKYLANPILSRALDILFILHADHEQNCSTNTMRGVGSAQGDPYVGCSAAAAALYGPLHGGANEEVLKMLDQIGSKDRVAGFIHQVKEGGGKLMGFGHRVYKNYDPRARIIKWAADQVFTVTGYNKKIEIALELERIALEDDYFVTRKLYPNVDFYSGIIYEAMGFRPDLFTVLFAIPRVVGWLAQWQEMLLDPEQKIARPRQIYTGHGERHIVPMSERHVTGVGAD